MQRFRRPKRDEIQRMMRFDDDPGWLNESFKSNKSFEIIGLLGERRDKPACCRGRKSPTGKENSESILALSLAGDIARCRLKRRQRYRWAGLLSFEKPMEQDVDSVPIGRKTTQQQR